MLLHYRWVCYPQAGLPSGTQRIQQVSDVTLYPLPTCYILNQLSVREAAFKASEHAKNQGTTLERAALSFCFKPDIPITTTLGTDDTDY